MPPAMPPFPADAALGDLFGSATDVLRDLLAVSLTGLIFYTPLYDPAGELVDFTFVYLNPAAQQMMRMPEQPTQTHNEQWPHSQAHGTFAFHVDAFTTGEPREFSVHYQADGYDNYYHLAARRSGQGLLVSFTDTAGQPRTAVEVALRESQARVLAARAEAEAERNLLQAVLAQAPVAISLFQGPELRITTVNEQMGVLWGRAPDQIRGLPLLVAVPELRGQGFDTLLTQVLDTQVSVTGTETPAEMLRDGRLQTTYYNFVYQPLYDAQGHVIGVVDVAVEVTEQVRARQQVQQLNQELEARVRARTEELATSNEELQESNRQLAHTNVDLDTFVYTASHDLKAPITNIEGLLDTLRGELPALSLDSEVPYILDLMADSVARFKHTIEHLTEVSKLQKSYDQPAQPVALAPVLDGVRLDLAPLFQQTGGHLVVDVQAVPTVLFSEKNLRSVVYNLLSNALKYHHPDRLPQVQVRAWRNGAHAVLEVQDNGLGFEQAREAQLFAMFQRLHTHVEGSGVGLYMVKRLVENAGGHVTVVSTVGEGTTFTVYLPG